LLIELNDPENLLFTLGSDGLLALRSAMEDACRNADPRATCSEHREAGFAVILPGCERQPAVHLGHRLIDRVREFRLGGPSGEPPTVELSVGVATVSLPPKNFPAEDLFAGAERCLYGSRASGGGVVKSIEIY
jgi:GGDEF domain-containing protein